MKIFESLREHFLNLKKSREVRRSIVYMIATMTGYGIVFLQNFSLAYFLTIDFFGKISLILSLFSTLYVLFTFGLNAVILRFYFDKNYASNPKSLTSHIVSVWMLLGFLLIIMLLLLGYVVIVKENYLQISYLEFVVITVASFFFSFTEIFPNLYIVEEKPLQYAAFLILNKALIFLLLHFGVFFFGESSYHMALMLLFSAICIFIIGLVKFKIFPIGIVSRVKVKEIIYYSFPLMIYALGGLGYSHGYRVIISSWLTYNELAIFTLSAQLASVYYLAASSSITPLYPKAYKRLEDSNGDPASIRFYLYALIYIGGGLLVVVLPMSYLFLFYFKSGSFFEAFKLMPVLLAGQYIFFLYGYSYILCTFFKKPKILTYSMSAGVITSLLLLNIFINKNHMWGAALPITCGFLVQCLVSIVSIKKVQKI